MSIGSYDTDALVHELSNNVDFVYMVQWIVQNELRKCPLPDEGGDEDGEGDDYQNDDLGGGGGGDNGGGGRAGGRSRGRSRGAGLTDAMVRSIVQQELQTFADDMLLSAREGEMLRTKKMEELRVSLTGKCMVDNSTDVSEVAMLKADVDLLDGLRANAPSVYAKLVIAADAVANAPVYERVEKAIAAYDAMFQAV